MAGDKAMLEKMKSERTVGLAVGLPLTAAGLGLATYGTIAYVDKPLKNFGWLMGGMLGGGLVAGVGIVVAGSPAGKQRWPKSYDSEEEAMGMVDTYNAEKLKELGITKEYVLEYLKQRTEAPALELHPWVAANGVGLTGTF
jgi:hypothetical protein